MAPALKAARLFTYRVGFGDCFLLRLEYDDRPRHVLVDFGTTSAAIDPAGPSLEDIAKELAADCQGGRLDAIVATHRHRDHVSGFAGAPWKILKQLRPGLAVLPWTEAPDAPVDGRLVPTGTRLAIGEASVAHARTLQAIHRVAAAAVKELERRGAEEARDEGPDDADEDGAAAWDAADLGPPSVNAPFPKRLAAQLRFVGLDNLQNPEAMANLRGLPKVDYVSYGSRTRLEDLLPGVKVRVLGPPTLAQTDAIRKQRTVDRDEFWHVMAAAGEEVVRPGGPDLFPGVKTVGPSALPLETRWFLKRLDALRAEELYGIVRALDDVLNNTSVILLLELPVKGGKPRRVLLPGDAQLENWSYALGRPGVREALAGVDVLKVGHHGSLNATPKTLWNLLEKRGGPGKRGRLRTVLSTRKGKHGSALRGTEVPRKPLLEALQKDSDLTSTMKGKAVPPIEIV
ncbi:MAG: MBL fold metallo-hydrolase [Anaeromyxobacter sp.]